MTTYIITSYDSNGTTADWAYHTSNTLVSGTQLN